MERGAIRGELPIPNTEIAVRAVPDFAALHPGYKLNRAADFRGFLGNVALARKLPREQGRGERIGAHLDLGFLERLDDGEVQLALDRQRAVDIEHDAAQLELEGIEAEAEQENRRRRRLHDLRMRLGDPGENI